MDIPKKNYELDQAAKDWTARVLPCEPPCDSYGVCENCCDKSMFQAGYNFAKRADEAKITELEEANKRLGKDVEILELRVLWLKEQRNHMIGAFSAVKDLGDEYVDEKMRLDDKAIEELSDLFRKPNPTMEK